MLLAIPYDATATLFKCASAPVILRTLKKCGKTGASELAEKSAVSLKVAWSFLKVLEKTEHVNRERREYRVTDALESDFIVINLRDRMCNFLFKRRATRLVLLFLARRKPADLTSMAAELNVPYRTLVRVINDLKATKLLTGLTLREELLRKVEPMQMIPRKNHRVIVGDFIRSVQTFYSDFSEPIVLFGKASWGEPTLSFDIMGLVEDLSPGQMYKFTKALVDAASAVTFQRGALINLAVSSVDAWLAHELKLVYPPHSLLVQALNEGICVHGQLPVKRDYFELLNRVIPVSTEKIEEWLTKGYVVKNEEGKLEFAEKAFEEWRKKPDKPLENTLTFNGKNVLLIGLTHEKRS